MSKRPLVVTLTALLFLAAGVVGLAYHASKLTTDGFRVVEVWVLVLRLLAIAIGVLLLRGTASARWLAVAWLVYHVILSVWHSASEVATHAVLLAAIAYALFRTGSSKFFDTRRLILTAIALFAAGCTGRAMPTQPTGSHPVVQSVAPAPSAFSLEAEHGSGNGDIRHRSQASGSQTVHLGPGERRSWTFTSASTPSQYVVVVRYSNGRYGPRERITLVVDGVRAGAFDSRETGEDTPEGWNAFVSDDAGASMLRAGNHTVTLEVAGGDGCVEIDVVTLTPRER